MKKSYSVQEWLPISKILNKGIIQLNNQKYIKIIKIIPINYNLKSTLEKQAILNSYKTFLKTCNFDIQILIQTKKEDLSKHISKIKNQMKKQNNHIIELSQNYIDFIYSLNHEKKSSTKNYFILIENSSEKNIENNIIENLNDKYFKIKECLSRCGNLVYEISDINETKEIIYSFLNTKKYLN